jgi:hypothetical protein
MIYGTYNPDTSCKLYYQNNLCDLVFEKNGCNRICSKKAGTTIRRSIY